MPSIHERANEWVAKANNSISTYRKGITRKHFWIAAGLIILLILLNYNIKAVIVVSLLGLLASYSTIYKRYLRIPSAIEFITFGTVMTSIAFGPTVGAIFGVVTTFAAEIISGAVDIFTFLYMFVRAFIGLSAGYLYYQAGFGIVMVGVISSVIFICISAPFYILPGDFEAKLKAVYFFIVNIGFNFILFTILGNFAVNLIL